MKVTSIGDVSLVETVYEKRDKVAYITLDRESAANAFNVQMCNEMTAIWTDFNNDQDSWVAVVTGAGEKYFCSGVDVKESRTRPMGHIWLPVARIMEEIHKPIISAVNGICCGGGLHFLSDTDIIIGSTNAVFFDSHVNVGLVSGWEPIGLSRRIPLNYVLRMTLQGRNYKIDAAEALRIGLVTEIVEPDQLQAKADEIAQDILQNAPLATRWSKHAIIEGLNHGMRDSLELSAYMLKEVWDTEDRMEGAQAFAERRKPVWKGK